MQYDTQWTPQERARVEALRLLDARGKFGASEAAEFGEACVRAAKPLAEFIAGPEAKHPYPWDQAREAYAQLTALLTADGTRNEWSAPEVVEVPAATLRQIRGLLTEEPPF